MHDCAYYQDQCAAYLDGELNAADQAELDIHLAVCPDCAEYLGALREMGRTLAVGDSEIPSSLHEDIMGVVLAEANSTARAAQKRHYMPVFTMLSAAAVVVLLVMTGTVGDLMGTGRTDSMAGTATVDGAARSAPGAAKFDAPAPAQSIAPDTGAAADNAAPKSARAHAAAPAADAPAVNDVMPGDAASGDAAPSVQSVPEAGTARMAALPELPELPAALQSESFAFCYVAEGGGTLPEFGGVLAAESADQTAHYYRVKGTSLEKALTALTEAGYEAVSQDNAPGIVIDHKAGSGLLIILY